MLSEVRLSADVSKCETVSGGTNDLFSAKASIKWKQHSHEGLCRFMWRKETCQWLMERLITMIGTLSAFQVAASFLSPERCQKNRDWKTQWDATAISNCWDNFPAYHGNSDFRNPRFANQHHSHYEWKITIRNSLKEIIITHQWTINVSNCCCYCVLVTEKKTQDNRNAYRYLQYEELSSLFTTLIRTWRKIALQLKGHFPSGNYIVCWPA